MFEATTKPNYSAHYSGHDVISTFDSHLQSVASATPSRGEPDGGSLPYIDPQRCKERESRAVLVRSAYHTFRKLRQIRKTH